MKKRLLSMLMAVLMIASLVPATALAAGGENPVSNEKHYGHDVLTVNIKADAATKQPGITLTWCNDCDEAVKALEVTPFAGADGICQKGTHDKSGIKVLQETTCEKHGLKVVYCSKCGYADTKTALVEDKTSGQHTYNVANFTVVVAPTCETAGYGYVKCATCGEAKFVYGGGNVDEVSWEAPYALHYLYLNKDGAVKTNDKTAVAAMFNATNPGHANNSKLVTATETTYKYVWSGDEGSDYGKLVKEVKYYGQVDPTHVQKVSRAYIAGTDSYKSLANTWNFTEWTKSALFDEDGNRLTGKGQVGSIYCPDCGVVTNPNEDGNEIAALDNTTYQNKSHKVTFSEAGYLPYMDTYGVKHDGKTDLYICDTCGKVGGETIPYDSLFLKSFPSEREMTEYMAALGRLFNSEAGYGYTTDDKVIVGAYKATCTKQGYAGQVWTLVGNENDGYKWTKTGDNGYIDMLGHSMKLVDSKAATCQEIGWTVSNYSVCTVCGATEGTSVVKVDKVKHNFVAKDLIAPTCQSAGMTVLECSYCKQLKGQVEGKFVTTSETTTTKAGDFATATLLAANCNNANVGKYVYVDYVKSVPHKAGDLVNVKEATCTEKGYTGDAYCVWCNTQLVKGSETALKEHTPVNVEKVPATCTENGTEAGTKCSVCETVLTGCEVITAEGHKYVKQDDAVAATCTEAGKEASEKCSVCDDVVEGKVIDALGHKYENGVCTACGAKDPEYVAPEFKDAASIAEYAKEAVTWAANAQVVKGDDKGNFNPTANITRQDFVTMLWRLKGEAASNQALTFTDKADIAEYAATAVAWAVENGYIKGYKDGSFAPTANITRAEIVAILDRIAGNAKAEKEATFTDVVGHWAAAEIAWAAEKDVVNGVGDNKFAPDDNATRQDTVVMLYRFANLK